MTLDIDHVRRRSPARFDGFGHLGNPGSSLVLGRVANPVRENLLTISVQDGASCRHTGRVVERLAEARARIALLRNPARPEEIVSRSSRASCRASGLRPVLLE